MKKLLLLLLPLLFLTACSSNEDKQAEARDYCESKGGIIEIHNDQEICFINDGRDGIRCRADLYLEKECGHDDSQEDTGGELIMHLNTDLDGDIPFVVVGKEGQKIVAFKKPGVRTIDKLVISDSDGEQGVVTIGSNQLPETLEYKGATLTFSNYTDTTYDLTVTDAEGNSEVITGNPIGEQASLLKMLMPTAYAQAGIGTDAIPGLIENYGQKDESLAQDYYAGTAGQVLGILGCGLNVGIAVATGGSMAPMAWIGCGALTTRVVTSNTEIGPCQGDVLECAKDTVLAWIKGTTLKGAVSSSEGGKVKGATLTLYHPNTEVFDEDRSNVFGSYEFSKFGDAKFIMVVQAKDMQEKRYEINSLAQKRLLIKDLSTGQTAFDSGLAETPKDFKFEFRFDVAMQPVEVEEEEEEAPEEEIPTISSDSAFSGDYSETFSHPRTITATEQGATVVTKQTHDGVISIAVNGKKATCKLSTDISFSTTIDGIGSGSGNIYSSSKFCSGTVDSKGHFELTANVTGELNVPNQPVISIDSTSTISGDIVGDSIAGEIKVPNADPIPFGELEEKEEVWKITFQGANVPAFAPNCGVSCFFSNERSPEVFRIVIEGKNVSQKTFGDPIPLGTIDEAGNISLNYTGGIGNTTVSGHLNSEEGAGSGTWAVDHSESTSGSCRVLTYQCDSTWTAEKE